MDMNRRELLKQKLMAAAALGLAGVAGNAIAQGVPKAPPPVNSNPKAAGGPGQAAGVAKPPVAATKPPLAAKAPPKAK